MSLRPFSFICSIAMIILLWILFRLILWSADLPFKRCGMAYLLHIELILSTTALKLTDACYSKCSNVICFSTAVSILYTLFTYSNHSFDFDDIYRRWRLTYLRTLRKLHFMNTEVYCQYVIKTLVWCHIS